ncbi:hypothetical protein [Legionella sp. PC997]|uniref:hypothetical protein n=1 Tax=Legionella sp. PC997 TaxID=2755562 RepID=UPI0015FD8C1E|nr:hypothetical protein [Legionella sp. PC997]QMT60980.1 hypothetical protein HBNCFIEN_02370 [Legionella sp. PC997]
MDALKHLEALITAKIAVFKTVYSLFRLEAQLAGLSVFPLLLNICMLFVGLITIWLTAMVFIGYLVFWVSGYWVLLISHRILISILFVLLLNGGLLLGLLKYLSFNLKSMSFPKTREYFSQKSVEHEKLEKAANGTNSLGE